MRKIMILALFVVSAAGWGQAQEMPPEIKRFLDNYTKDSTAHRGPLYYKSMGAINDSVQIKDLKMRTIQEYTIKDISLNEYPDTVALSEIIKSGNMWRVLIMAHNKPLYELMLSNTEGKPRFVRGAFPYPPDSDFKSKIWEPLLKVYPESTGINPVLVSRWNGSSMDRFLYFKEKGPRKIYFLPDRNDTLNLMFTTTMETLDDSRKLIEYWKKEELNKDKNADGRMGLEKAKSISKETKNESQESLFPAYRRGNLQETLKKQGSPFLLGGEQ
jgi:hypothetical protein